MEREVKEMSGTSYTVTDFGEYIDVLTDGERIAGASSAENEGVVSVALYRLGGKLYSLSTLDYDKRVYMVRLA